MAAFSDQAFKAKLKDLNSTQQSIQTISLWAIHHRRHHAKIVAIWMEELREAKAAARKLTLLYFANDVVQNMRKKGLEFQTEFQTVLVEAFTDSSKQARIEGDDKILKSLGKLAAVWRDRASFEEAFIVRLEGLLVDPPVAAAVAPQKPSVTPGKPSAYVAAVSAVSHTPPLEDHPSSFPKRIKIDTADFQTFSKSHENNQSAGKNRLEPHSDDEDYEEAVFENGSGGSTESPKLETLLRLVQKLQAAPSANATIRSKIAELPPVITDPQAIDKISDATEIERLVGITKDGIQMVMEYNVQLNQELQDRQAVAAELARQLAYHRKLIEEKELLREELAQQISERRAFRDKLVIHVDSLPDMSRVGTLSSTFNVGALSGNRTSAGGGKLAPTKNSLFKSS